MKISMNWLLDHIATPLQKIDVGLIAAKFNIHTAEIEHYDMFNLDSSHLFLARVVSFQSDFTIVHCDELEQSMQLSYRNDVQIGDLVFIRRQGQDFSWEKLSRYSSTKDGLFPSVDCQPALIAGGWRALCEESDYILDVDNKSINHRPDLWGHRGIAREIAAFMGWQMKPLEHMLARVPEVIDENSVHSASDHAIEVAIENPSVCPRLAALHCSQITHKPSQIWMAMRLARVDSKPINTIVDITNYVMFDISQPMHVFDAANFPSKKIAVRTAFVGESLELLDGSFVALQEQDIVITDGLKPVALAGVMGGRQASFTHTAHSIIIESGSFQAAMVRNSATRVKISSEASARFAKQLDPMQNTTALLRFVYVAQGLGVLGSITEKMVSVGKIVQPTILVVAHSFIEERLGATIESQQVIDILSRLNFTILIEQQAHDIIYHVTVPTLRTTKDITIPEDIVEEVVRLYGFVNIAYKRPVRQMRSFDLQPVLRLRKMKEHCAFAFSMHEVRDYLFYDESFLKRLDWYPDNAVAIKNPVSENWKVLVTSLIPHLLKNVELNSHTQEQIRLFECNNIWTAVSDEQSIERKALAGIFVGDKNLDFYDYKALLQGLFTSLDVTMVWQKSSGEIEPWFERLQVADLFLEGIKVGRAGMISAHCTRHIFKQPGFIFELFADALIHYPVAQKTFQPWSKYQAVSVDISMLVDAFVSAQELEGTIAQVDSKIDQVTLLDFFEKEEWAGKRSLTFRYRITDFEQNLSKDVVDEITNRVIQTMTNRGALIR